MPTSHDSGYKLLFSDPLIVRDLIQGFIDDPWLQKLDFSTLEPVKGHYVSEDLRDRMKGLKTIDLREAVSRQPAPAMEAPLLPPPSR